MRAPVLPSFLLFLCLTVSMVSSSWAYMALLRQGTDTTEVANAGDAHGRALAAGDFDGDGYDDLAMAAPDESNGLSNLAVHGGVVIAYGSPAGLTHTGADWISVGDLGVDDVRFGRSLAAADFDQDGYDDLAVGLPYVDLIGPTRVDAGQVWIYYGSPSGLQLAHGTVLDQGVVTGAAIEDGDLFGWSLATGFFDADTFPDLAVGAIGEDGGAGVVFYFYGAAAGMTATGSGWSKLADLGDVSEPNAWLGYALTSDDFDGNGFDDLAVSAPKKTVASLTTAGRVYVIYSTASGVDDTFVDIYDALGLGLEAQNDAYFGWSLSSGNYWTLKSSRDLAIGEPQFDVSGAVDAGRAIVLRFDPPPTIATATAGTNSADVGRAKATPADINILRQGVNGNESREAGDQFGYALASGQFEGDALDELAVSAPFEDITLPGLGNLFDSGALTIFEGNPLGPIVFNNLWSGTNVSTQNDHPLGGEKLGQALCFGDFEDGTREALAIGAPGRDYEDFLDGGTDIDGAGAVYIAAPWRQPVGRPHRSSVVLDCDGNLAYAQRPFDLVNPASTTKTLTTLLSCEAIAADPQLANYLYTVDWARSPNIGGSLVPLYFQEKMIFSDLMKTFMTRSGNDAGYALADIMTGETAVWSSYTGTLPGFATTMNNRLAQIGLSPATTMTNPSGMDYGFDPDHRTSAMDWVELARAAMSDNCVRTVVGEPCWTVPRDVPSGLEGWLNLNAVPIQTEFCNGFVNGLRSGGFPANGVKGGSTPSAQKTGLGSATALGGEVYAAWFGVRKKDDPEGAVAGSNSATGRELLQVGRSRCEANDFAPPPPGPAEPFAKLEGLSSVVGEAMASCFDLSDEPQSGVDPADVRLFLQTRGTPTQAANLRMALDRTSTVDCRVGETIAFNYTKVQTHEGLRIQNMGASAADLSVVASHPRSATWVFNLPPGSSAEIPSTIVGGQTFDLSLTNLSSVSDAELALHDLGVTFSATLGVASPETFDAALTRTGGTFSADQLCVYAAGQDPSGSTIVDLSVHGGSQSTTVPGDDGVPGAGRTLRLETFPNPFNPATTLRFSVPRQATVEVAVFDVAGRRIRTLVAGEVVVAGWHEQKWDGRDATGALVASGVYHVRVAIEGDAVTRRVVLLK